MKRYFTPCMKDIIRYVLRFYKDPDNLPTPNWEVLHVNLRSKYSKERIDHNIEQLLEDYVLTEYGEYDYLDFTGSFIRSQDYENFKKTI
ncbi:MAG: hypothetical protein R6U96_03895 [Promethearchaeia archaeon]